MLLKTKEHKLVETDGLIQDLLERIESKDCTLKKNLWTNISKLNFRWFKYLVEMKLSSFLWQHLLRSSSTFHKNPYGILAKFFRVFIIYELILMIIDMSHLFICKYTFLRYLLLFKKYYKVYPERSLLENLW